MLKYIPFVPHIPSIWRVRDEVHALPTTSSKALLATLYWLACRPSGDAAQADGPIIATLSASLLSLLQGFVDDLLRAPAQIDQFGVQALELLYSYHPLVFRRPSPNGADPESVPSFGRELLFTALEASERCFNRHHAVASSLRFWAAALGGESTDTSLCFDINSRDDQEVPDELESCLRKTGEIAFRARLEVANTAQETAREADRRTERFLPGAEEVIEPLIQLLETQLERAGQLSKEVEDALRECRVQKRR